MIYFLFLKHPKGEELYSVPKEKEDIARRYFKSTSTLETEVSIEGKSHKALIDYQVFANLANFDCFNCLEHCCADTPAVHSADTRELVLENLDEYNRLTKNVDILKDLGYSMDEIEDSISRDPLMIPERHIEEEIELCTCSFKPNNRATICALHSLCLDKDMGAEEILRYKPTICSLWPIEILAEDDLSLLYISLPDDFTNEFSIEDYYSQACINKEYADSPEFRRKNPEGFSESDYKPLIISYADTIKYGLGEDCYLAIKNRLIEDGLVSQEEFSNSSQQINKTF